MARYVVLRCESEDSAEKIMAKFAPLEHVNVVGLFASPTAFCPGKPVCGAERRLITSKKYGTSHCSVCKRAVTTISQHPRNLLQDPDLHPRYRDLAITVYEPFTSADPLDKYKKTELDASRDKIERARERLTRWKKRRARRGR